MRKSLSVALFLAALMVLSVGAVPVAAQPSWSASGGSASASPGDTVQVTFSVTNTGDEIGTADVTVQNNSLPSGWSVTDISANDPNPVDQYAVLQSGSTAFFTDVDPGETVTVTATVDVPGGAAEGDYTLDSTVTNTTSGTQVGTPSSTITVGGAGPFTVGNLSPTNPTVAQGGQATVSADITNQGSDAGDTEVRLIVDGSQQASTTLSGIAAGASQTASFDFQAPSTSGTVSWSIETDDDSASGSLTVSQAGPFSVDNLSPANPTVSQGDQVSVSADITNQGSVAGDTDVRLLLDGNQQASTTLSGIAAGASQTASFNFQAPSTSGTVGWSIETNDDSASGSLTVSQAGPFTIADTPNLQPASVAPGDVVTVTVNVTNAGGASGSTTVQVSAPWGETASTTTPPIAAGATQQVSLSITAPSTEAAYSIDVSTPAGTQTLTLTVDTLAPYLDGQGNVQTSGLTTAINDWRSGQIQTPTLIDVINGWRSSN